MAMYLDPVTVDTGCLRVIPGSHNIGDVFDKKTIEDTIRDVDAVIYNIGLIRQFPRKGITFENIHFEGAKLCIDTASKLE